MGASALSSCLRLPVMIWNRIGISERSQSRPAFSQRVHFGRVPSPKQSVSQQFKPWRARKKNTHRIFRLRQVLLYVDEG